MKIGKIIVCYIFTLVYLFSNLIYQLQKVDDYHYKNFIICGFIERSFLYLSLNFETQEVEGVIKIEEQKLISFKDNFKINKNRIFSEKILIDFYQGDVVVELNIDFFLNFTIQEKDIKVFKNLISKKILSHKIIIKEIVLEDEIKKEVDNNLICLKIYKKSGFKDIKEKIFGDKNLIILQETNWSNQIIKNKLINELEVVYTDENYRHHFYDLEMVEKGISIEKDCFLIYL